MVRGLVARTGHGAEMENLRFTSSLWSAVNIAKADVKKDTCVLKGYDLDIEDNDTHVSCCLTPTVTLLLFYF